MKLRCAGIPALLALLGLAALPVRAQYAYTRIADTAGPLRTLFTPSLNDAGQVAFRARLGGGVQGIFVGDGGALTTIADTTGLFSGLRDPSLNNAGQVAFHSLLSAGGEGIVVGSGGPTTTLYDTSGPFSSFRDPSLNDAGQVAFRARFDTRGGGIFAGNGGPAATVAPTAGPYNEFGNPRINNSGQTVFFAGLDAGGSGIFVNQSGVDTIIADNSGAFGVLSGFSDAPVINNAGQVAFRALLGGVPQGLFISDGGVLTTVADTGGPFSAFLGLALNDFGQVAFHGFLDTGGEGIFTGPDPVANRVLLLGAPLDGSTVTGIEFLRALNNNGSLAFRATLADGRQGIYRADPVGADVTAGVSVVRGGFRRVRSSGRYVQRATLTNNGGSAIAGPLSLALDSLSPNATLFNATGMTGLTAPSGSPYQNVDLSLVGNGDGVFDPGETATLDLEFVNPTDAAIAYTPRLLAGPGGR